MRKGIAALAVGYSAIWALILFPWVEVQDQSLTGSELSQLLLSLPGIAVLTLLISLYGRLSRTLVISSGLVMVGAGTISLLSDFSLAPASLQLQESITGIIGESSLATETIWPAVFFVLSLVVGLASIPVSRMSLLPKSSADSSYENDSRSIWDNQSEG